MKIEFYKSAMLTLIAGILGFVAWQVHAGKVAVVVSGGQIDIGSVSDSITVSGSVDVDNTVSVVIE